MLSKEELIVLHHYLEQGLSKTRVAQRLGISRRTVQRHAVREEREPQYGPRPPRPSILDPYKHYLKERLREYPELSAVRLLGEIQALGFGGRYTVVKDYVKSQRPRSALRMEQRFEVEPGEQAQVDFATFKTPFGTVYALLVVLSWSRMLWVRFYLHQDQLTVLGGLHQAFLYFGGVPKTVLFDRMKTAVAGSDREGKALFNAEMLRFSQHYGFTPRACRPYRAKTKGRVERAVSYLRHSFFYARTFRDLEDLNAQVEIWLGATANARLHGTTGEVPAHRMERERPHLLSLPHHAYVPVISLGRRVTKDGFVSYNGNQYSVPDQLNHLQVEVQATLEEVKLYQDGRLLVVHPLLEGRGQRRLAPEHRRHRPETELQETSLISEMVQVQRRSLDVYELVLQ
jgi:transposase